MSVRYYKVEDRNALAAYQLIDQQRKVGNDAASELEKRFDGVAIFRRSLDRITFIGLKLSSFKLREDSRLWVKPSAHHGFASWPKARTANLALKGRLVEMRVAWRGLVPEPVELEPFYQTLGISWCDLVFGGIDFFECDGVIYVGTSASLNVGVEILGSEFNEMKKMEAA
ncbi:hypothetical protein HWQ46_21705 [Shewanella sp. D64]|uniref:hypothetical protein n=1 Tax=unclassified Shewanella TaxID=196818 RepID=UPI0022BA411D|nr:MULTISPECIES: hypothetical protein [unclassified Shewanella]MEC4728156.1 hypothetical protein [Shewanella sp. D64]MEC4740276.1 hypothetical protein [Shewanella sp. E94]WBJ94408.1 hypothetical protein HWQ47_21450 [Shewanella sp. MTB7]